MVIKPVSNQSVSEAASSELALSTQGASARNQAYRPWAIARILPKAQVYILARFRNRQDADDHKRVLQRFIPAAKFEIIFDPADEKQQDNQA